MADTAELEDADNGAGGDDLVQMESAMTDIAVRSHVSLGQCAGLRARQILNSNSNLKPKADTVSAKFAGKEGNGLLGKGVSKQAFIPNPRCVLASGINEELMRAGPAGFLSHSSYRLKEKLVAFASNGLKALKRVY